jgi:hypothetical protein
MGQKDGEKWPAAVDSQPTNPKSDRLLGSVHAVFLSRFADRKGHVQSAKHGRDIPRQGNAAAVHGALCTPCAIKKTG